MSPWPLQGPSTAQLGSYTAKDLLSAAFARHTSTDNLSSRLNKLQVKTDHTHTHLSAPAQDNILLIRITWKGCRRTRMWKPSLPQVKAGDVLHPTAIRDHTVLCQHVIKVAGIELCESILLGDVDLRTLTVNIPLSHNYHIYTVFSLMLHTF